MAESTLFDYYQRDNKYIVSRLNKYHIEHVTLFYKNHKLDQIDWLQKRNSIRSIWGTCKALTTIAVYQVKYTRQKYFAFIYSHSSATHELKWTTAMKRGMNQYAIWY